MRLLLTLATLFPALTESSAQLRKFPLERLPQHGPGSLTSGRKKAAALTPPFFDDFSTAKIPWADSLLWQRHQSVQINNGMAIDQPTVNVATFDGLDSTGRAYDAQQVLVTGFNDNLTSQYIDLSEAAVSPEERGTVYLSFFFQWQGNGEAPDADDHLDLEFADADTAWSTVLTISPQDSFDRTKFYDTIIQVSDDKYFHDHFQFRFRNFGRQSGPYDTWNIDYVYLDKNRTIADLSFRDRAIASSLTSFFGTYTAIPYRHFKHRKEIDSVEFDIQNLYDSITSMTYNVDGTFRNYIGGDAVSFSKTFFEENRPIGRNEGSSVPSGVIFPGGRVNNRYDIDLPDINDPQQFNPDADSIDVSLHMTIFSQDAPTFVRNDTISQTWYLRNFYAYDDGQAEFSAGLIEPGTELAYRFDMHFSESIQADTLAGVFVYFPPYGITANQTVRFIVYHDDNGEPGEVWKSYPVPLRTRSVDGFQYIRFIPALLINEPSFYFGWEQPIAGKALVGLDIDNDTGDRIFVNTTGSDWFPNEVVRGSLMVRPVFAEGQLEDDLQVGVEEPGEGIFVYPNPNRGRFYIRGDYDRLRIYNVSGQEITYQAEQAHGLSTIEIPAVEGLYLVRMTKGEESFTRKIVISR